MSDDRPPLEDLLEIPEQRNRSGSDSLSEDEDFSDTELASPKKLLKESHGSVSFIPPKRGESSLVSSKSSKICRSTQGTPKQSRSKSRLQPLGLTTKVQSSTSGIVLNTAREYKGHKENPALEKNSTVPVVFGDYQIGEEIGKGGYGKVYKGFNKRNGQFVAIKEIKLSGESMEDLPNILGEIRLLKTLNHANIVRYIDYHYEHGKALYIVLEYIENGSLKDTVKKFGKLPEALTARYSFQVLQGLSYLHFKDILHGDIKGANILITKNGICKLADFGVARQLSPTNQISSTALGTTYWTAPEVLELSQASKASDVWSFGCTVIELLTGSPPHKELQPLSAVRKIIESDYPPFPEDISEELTDFLRCCFHKIPSQRSSISELMYHPWIRKYGRRKSSQPFMRSQSSEDIQDLLVSVNSNPETLYGMDFIKDDEFMNIVKTVGPDLVQKIEARAFLWVSPIEMNMDEIRQGFCDLQAENRLLQLLIHSLNEKIQDSTAINAPTQGVAKAIERVDNAHLKCIGDLKLAQTVFNTTHLPYDKFTNATRGILLMKRAGKKQASSNMSGAAPANKSHKWKKRWILLQNEFLFCYRPNCVDENPVTTIFLRERKIVPVAERDIGKKNCFMLVCDPLSYYFAAAKPDILIKWLCALDAIVPWYYSGNDELEAILEAERQKEIADQNSAKNRLSIKRTKTAPLVKMRSRKRVSLAESDSTRVKTKHGKEGADDSPFPGIPLKTEDAGDSPFPGIPLKTFGSVPLAQPDTPSQDDDSPFPGIRLKTEGSRNRDENDTPPPKSPQLHRRTMTLPTSLAPRRSSPHA